MPWIHLEMFSIKILKFYMDIMDWFSRGHVWGCIKETFNSNMMASCLFYNSKNVVIITCAVKKKKKNGQSLSGLLMICSAFHNYLSINLCSFTVSLLNSNSRRPFFVVVVWKKRRQSAAEHNQDHSLWPESARSHSCISTHTGSSHIC